MATTDTIETAAAEVAEAPKRTRKVPAKKADATVETTTESKSYLATAEGRGGKQNTRKVPTEVHFAVDVADSEGRTPAAKAGLVYRFFATEEKAQAFAEKKIAEGYDAIVVPATSKEA